MSSSKFKLMHVAVHDLMRLLQGSGYVYSGESLTQIIRNLTQWERREELRALESEQEDKEKKVLELRRQIATLCCREGFAFDAPKIERSRYDWCYTVVPILRTMEQWSEKLTAWILTDKGIYCLTGIVSRFYVPDTWRVEVAIESPPALQKINVFGYKLFNERGQCVKWNVYPTVKYLVPGDILSISRTIT